MSDQTISEQPGDASVRLERTYDVPIETMWRMWTEPEHFAAWYGPTGATVPHAEMDVREGGRRFVSMAMTGPDGAEMTMHFVGEYVEVTPPTRLVYTESMADADGTPQAGGHGGLTEVTVELRAAGDQTHLTLVHVGVPAGSPGEMGWTMALDALAGHVGG